MEYRLRIMNYGLTLKVVGAILSVIVLFFIIPAISHAADRFWVGANGGNINTTASWSTTSGGPSGASVPGTSDIAIFDSANTNSAVINANWSVAGIDIRAGYTGTITQGTGITVTVGSSNFSQAGGVFQGSNASITLSLASTFTLSGGTFQSTSGTLTIGSSTATGANFTQTGGIFSHNNGTVTFAGRAATIDVPTNVTFHNLTINKESSYTLTIASGDTLIVEGTLTLTDGQTATGTIEARGNVSVGVGWDGGAGAIKFTGSGNQSFSSAVTGTTLTNPITIDKSGGTVSMTGNIILNGAFTLTSGTLLSTSSNLQIGSASATNVHFTQTGGTFSHNNGTVTFGGRTQTIDVPTSITFHNLTIHKDITLNTLTIASGDTLIVEGTLTLTDGQTATGTIEARGNVSVGVGWDGGAGAIKFTGSGNQSFSSAVTGTTLTNPITIDKSGGTVSMTGNIILNGAFTLTSGTLLSTSDNLQIASGGVTNVHFTQTGGTFSHNNGTVTFGGRTQTIDVPTSITFHNLTIHKDITLNTLTIASGDTLIVEGTLTLTDGQTATGTIEARGNVSVGVGWDGGAGAIKFTGSGNQSFSSAVTGTTLTNPITIDKSGGTVSMTGNIILNGAFTLTSGTLLSTSDNLQIASGGVTNVHFTQTGGTFSHNNGTVTFGGRTQTIDVPTSITFYNLTIHKDTSTNIVTMGAGDIFIVENTLTLTDGSTNGGIFEARGNVTIASTYDGGNAEIKFTGSASTQTFTDAGAGSKPTGTITINKASGKVLLASNMVWNASGQDLMVTSGTLDLAGYNLTINDQFTIDTLGNLQLQGGETINKTPIISVGGTVTYTGLNGPYTIKNYAYSNLTINGGASSVFTFPAHNTGLLTTTITSGILSLGGFNMTSSVLVNDATLRLQGNETVSITTMDTNSGTVEYVGRNQAESLNIKDFGLTDYYILKINDTNGTKATFVAPASLGIAGGINLVSGNFHHNSGTVSFSAGSQSIAGNITFYNLTKIVSVASTLTFGAGNTVVVAGALTLQGAGDQLLSLRSSVEDIYWEINPQGTRTVAYLNVQDSKNVHASAIVCDTGCVDNGHNVNWMFGSALPEIQSITLQSARVGTAILIGGTHFGTETGSIVFTGGFGGVSGTISNACNVPGWTDTSVCFLVPNASAYTGTITLIRADEEEDTWGLTFRILPRITSIHPASGGVGTVIRIIGDHLCQAGGVCPEGADRASSEHNVVFNGTQAIISDFVEPSQGDDEISASITTDGARLLLALVSLDHENGAIVSHVSGGDVSWEFIGSATRSGLVRVEAWKAIVSSPLSFAEITASLSQTARAVMHIATFANAEDVGGNSSANGASSVPSTSVIVTPGSITFGALAVRGGASVSAGNGQTIISSDMTAGPSAAQIQGIISKRNVLASSGGLTMISYALEESSDWAIIAIEILPLL